MGKFLPFSSLSLRYKGRTDECAPLLGSMVTRLSGSAEETDNNDPVEAEPPPYANNGHGKKRSFTSTKFGATRHSDSLDRRKSERGSGLTTLSSNGPLPAPDSKGQPLLAPSHEIDKLIEPRNWRLSWVRSPWSCSLLTAGITISAVVLLLSIVHAFLTRQLDSKGCDMCWSRPIYFKFSDFDTEHTRFASKYHLYLHREGGFDEDPKVRGQTTLASVNIPDSLVGQGCSYPVYTR